MNSEKNSLLGMELPPVIFGTTGLGNLFVTLSDDIKSGIIRECINQSPGKAVFDSAGKYGAGLALETLGKILKQHNIAPGDVTISNKLGWLRTELTTDEPTFEPGAWKDLEYDAVQKISYDGILECFEQGNELLNGYIPQMVSVHDPDEYLAKAKDEEHAAVLYQDVMQAYEALYDLKRKGKVRAIGVGAKDWRVIQRIAGDADLDWVMIANSMTLHKHPQELLDFLMELNKKGVFIINAALFQSGFLVGGDYYDYKLVKPEEAGSKELFKWREAFFELCNEYKIKPAEACVQFGLNVPGVKSIALNAISTEQVQQNVKIASVHIPDEFWKAMKLRGLINIVPSKNVNSF